VEKNGAVAVVTFNNPKALNALTVDTFEALEQALNELAEDQDIRVVILTGAGEKAFVAGGDIGFLATLDVEGARRFALLAQKVIDQIEAFPKPVIAAINGYALGGGCELSMACDMRVAADTARFGQPEVKLGIIPGFAGTQRLARLVGKAKAKEMIFTGEMISAAEAERIGLVNRVVPADLLMVTDKSASAIALSKEAIDHGVEMDFARAARYEADLFGLSFATPDAQEGIAAFLEKRSPQFK
jgi:enoyl-CoA hydratase